MSKIDLFTVFAWLLVMALGSASCAEAESEKGNFRDEVSYTNDIQPVVKNFCTTCHAGDDPEGDLILTSYDQVRDQVENGELLARINDHEDPMPEDGLMPQHLRRLFKTWAENGYLHQGTTESRKTMEYQEFKAPTIAPIDVSKEGFEMLAAMQGHWVGSMNLMGTDYDWMAFDYRPIAPSHVHGIFEGGTMGNLFTSFFVAEFKGTKTILARNGGVLNGIYRTSYFVLNEVSSTRKGRRYQLVDAFGGKEIMWMELFFSGNKLEFNAYTSRLGLKAPKLHMSFKGQRKRPELAATAAQTVSFPKNVLDFKMPDPLPIPTWVGEYPHTSATYLYEEQDRKIPLDAMAKVSKDPRRIDQMPFLSELYVSIKRTDATKGKKLLLYLSQKALTDRKGQFIKRGRWIRMDLLDSLLSFPEISGNSNEFNFTYLHPGNYFLTVIADMDEDGFPSPGDITHPVTEVEVKPESTHQVLIENLTAKN